MAGIIFPIPTLKRSLGNGSCTYPQKRTRHLLSLITPSWRWADALAGLFTSLAWMRHWGIMKPLCAVKMALIFSHFMDGVSMLKIQQQLWLSSHLMVFSSMFLITQLQFGVSHPWGLKHRALILNKLKRSPAGSVGLFT